MLKKVTASVAALAAMGFASSAMAQFATGQGAGSTGSDFEENYGVHVNIDVLESVSVWGFEDVVTLELAGNDGNNSAFHDSQFNYINNTPASISVGVNGTLSNDVNFFIVDNPSGAAVVAAMGPGGNAYNPAGVGTVLRWHAGDMNPKVFDSNVETSLTAGTREFTYVASSPGSAGGVAGTEYDLEVTWTIAPL